MISPRLLLPLLLPSAAVAAEQAPTAEELRFKVLVETQIVVVDKLPVPAGEYTGDGNPDTLEIVMLPKEAGPSRVSDDGEVIFDNAAPDDEKAALMDKAISIRVQRRMSGT
jgi:hypothetical protein